MDELHHECGIAAVCHLPSLKSNASPSEKSINVSTRIPRMLLDLQQRGQLAAGLTSYNPEREKLLDTYKQIGVVTEVFRLSHRAKASKILNDHSGQAAIGHVRYATCGENQRSYAQPFQRYHGCKWKWFSFAYNGQLSNYAQLRNELLSQTDYHLTRQTDTEIIMHYISRELSLYEEKPDLREVFRNVAQNFEGAYNLVLLNAMGDLVVMRDPKGFHPLCYAHEGDWFAAASESVALTNLGFEDVKSVEPGTMILVEDGEVKHARFAGPEPSSHCFFEWIYFSNVASTLDGRSVYLSRAALGQELAEQEKRLNRVPLDKDTIVVPVPDTGKAAADSMAYELKLPSLEGLIRNRYVGRTFIEGEGREERVRQKYTPLSEVMEGKRILLVEDTIVRSTTMQQLISNLRDRGKAAEIHVRVACPPIISPCFYGIDMSTRSELFAPDYQEGEVLTIEDQERMAKALEADSLFYLPVDSIARCIGLGKERLCQGCITTKYPTPTGQELFELSLKMDDSHNSNGRLLEQALTQVRS